ncbi:MAG: Crp/Fnr family transcriptional regulator [Planctomycetota bacterium]|jgi:CRP/FNR family transcriptional regulator
MNTDALSCTEMFSTLSEDKLKKLTEIGIKKDFKKGEIIFDEGSPGDSFAVIADGKAEIARNVAGGRRRVLSIMGRGGVFGEIAMFQKADRSAGVRAETDCSLIIFTKEAFLAFLEKDHDAACKIYLYIIHDLSERLRVTNEKLNESAVWGFQEALAM